MELGPEDVSLLERSEPAETVEQVGHLLYHFLVVHTGNDVTMYFIRDSELRSHSRKVSPPMYWYAL